MKTQKVKLNEIEVISFITNMNNAQKLTIAGGAINTGPDPILDDRRQIGELTLNFCNLESAGNCQTRACIGA